MGPELTGLEQVMSVGNAYIAFSQLSPVYFDIVARCALREVNTHRPRCQRDRMPGLGDESSP